MATTIKLKNSVTTTAAPSTLVQGEAAVNVTDKKVWVGDASSSPVQIIGAGAPVSGTTGTFTGNVSVAGTFAANGGATLGDASGDALTINSNAVSIPNGLTFNSGAVAFSNNPTFSGGTANGVLYLNGSKVATSGSDLTFDGSTLFTPNLILPQTAWTLGANSATASLVGYGSTGSGGTTNTLVFNTNGSERMRITSAGNVGIGTSSPSFKLDVVGTTSQTRIRANATTAQTDFGAVNSGGALYLGLDDSTGATTGTAYASYIYSTAAKPLLFYTNGSLKATLDSSGNLGLGVTPSAWSLLTGLQIKYANFAGYSNNAYMSANAYFNGSAWNYQASSYANAYMQQSGQHQWYNAASGTAGNAISFTQAMTLDASGNLGIGTTSPTQKLHLAVGSASTIYNRIQNTAGNCYLGLLASGDTVLSADSAGNQLLLYTSATERMRIDSSGNVGVGTSSPYSLSNYNSLTVGGAAGGGLTMYRFGSTNVGYVGGNNSNELFINNLLSNGFITLSTNNTERMRIDSSGNLLVGLTSATSGGGVLQVSNGITFPATQSASSNANTLDDYEEGTWTPTLLYGGTITTNTYAGVAAYTKIGRQVTITFGNCTISGTPNDGNPIYIGSLPFTPAGQGCGSFGFINSTSTFFCGFFTDGGNLAFGARDGDYLVRNSDITGSSIFFSATVTYFV